MASGGEQFRPVGYLIDGNETDTEVACSPHLAALISRGYEPEPVEITSVLMSFVYLPWTIPKLDLSAVAKDTIVLYDNCIVAHVEGHRRCPTSIVRVLNELVRKRTVALQVT